MIALYYLGAFFLGSAIGSFILALVERLHARQPFFADRSKCPDCHHRLGPMDLIPLVSFFLIGRRCRYCKKPLSWKYVLSEAVFAILFLGTAMVFSIPITTEETIKLFVVFFITSTLGAVFLSDWWYKEIPLILTLVPAFIMAGVNIFWLNASIANVLIGIFVGAGFFALQYLVSRGRWIGGGDVYLGVYMGVLLGWPLIVVALMVAYVGGAAVSVLLLSRGKHTLKSEVAFGTYLVGATVLALLWGNGIIAWYLRMGYVL